MFQVAVAEAGIPFIEGLLGDRSRVVRLNDFEGELLLRVERAHASRRSAPE